MSRFSIKDNKRAYVFKLADISENRENKNVQFVK